MLDSVLQTHQAAVPKFALWIVIFIAIAAGCDRSAELVQQADGTAGSKLVSSVISPRGTIEECVAAYGRLSSYEDNAYVLLRYRLDGQDHADRAPLAIAWEPGGKIGLQVYSVTAGPDQGRWRLRVEQDEPPNSKQVLSRSIPRKLDFDWLLSDAFVAQHLSAGLAGLPPQLDLLLGENPLGRLVDDSAMLAFEQQQSIDGRACHVIAVTRGNARYELYIDRSTMLLRRLRLPDLNLPQQMLADKRVTDASLTIEFEDVRTNQTIGWERFRVVPRADELLVNRFVPPPSITQTDGLGEQIPAFTLSSADQQPVYSSAGGAPNRKATVLMWLADHPGCRIAAEQLSAIATAISADSDLSAAVEFVPIWSEPTPAAGTTFASLADEWNLPGQLALDTQAMGRDLFSVTEAPTLVILDAENRLQLRQSRTNPHLGQIVPNLLSRLVGGEDLAATMIAESRDSRARHRSEMRNARSVDASAKSNTVMKSYGSLIAELRPLKHLSHKIAAVTVCSGANSGTWTLYADGGIMQQQLLGDDAANVERVVTPWAPTDASRLTVDPSEQYAVLYRPSETRFEIFNIRTRQNRVVDLGSDARLVDLKWLTLNGSKSTRLAAITSDSQLVLLDPKNHEQLSGRCPSLPQALLAISTGSAVNGLVVLADGSVEPIQLSNQSAHNSVPMLGRRVSHSSPSVDSTDSRRFDRLQFQPAKGPWQKWHEDNTELILARGWIAKNEPALFMLDGDLNRRWHYRVGLHSNLAPPPTITVAKDPSTGQPVWIMADAEQTIFLMRSDGLADHFRFDRTFVGLTLETNGHRLLLGVVYPRETIVYNLVWASSAATNTESLD